MCAEHWRLVPRRLHNAIYDGYRDFLAGLALPESYRVAVREAVAIASRAKPAVVRVQSELFRSGPNDAPNN